MSDESAGNRLWRVVISDVTTAGLESGDFKIEIRRPIDHEPLARFNRLSYGAEVGDEFLIPLLGGGSLPGS